MFGAVALLTILTAHGVVRIARFQPGLAKMFDHRIRVLVHDGQIRKDQLRLAPDRCRCGTMATFFMARPLLDPVVRGA